jgi:hypothetical protein
MSRTRNRKKARPHPAKWAATAPPMPLRRKPPAKRRLRSTYVILGSVGTLFAGLCLYGVVRDRDRNCVDANGYVVADRECENGSNGSRWYYGGVSSGGKMNGGSFERGGFGGHGGGGS